MSSDDEGRQAPMIYRARRPLAPDGEKLRELYGGIPEDPGAEPQSSGRPEEPQNGTDTTP